MSESNTDRRSFLRQAGLTVGAATALPLLDAQRAGAATWGPEDAATGSHADRLFRAGRFEEADRGYARILCGDPDNAHVHAQRGYIALLSNRFTDAEKFLTKAVGLEPGDTFSKERLADCHVRQDRFAQAVPLLRAAGKEAYAEQYASLSGTPYEVRGAQSTRLAFTALNPMPLVEVSVNGAPAAQFILATGAPLAFTMDTAEKAGLRAVATSIETVGYQAVTMHHGVVGSLQFGGIELRNVPVVWHDGEQPHPLGQRQPAGTLGTSLLYHFLATVDFGNRALTLRRKTGAQLNEFRAEARRAGADRLPLWLADARLPCTLGGLNDHGPKVVTLDTGVEGAAGAVSVITTEAIAERADIRMDHKRPNVYGAKEDATPFIVQRPSIGRMTARNLYGFALKQPLFDERIRFQTLGNFTLEFLKPFALTFDYANMHLYVSHK
ncbi:retropepsin-like aspartic protease [Actinomadura sp. NEAU-AAG7]|uniref:retropepsin-like aspartic protease n=1 Tax=Actinomadura sp. NEAU-AAG7 TaxID=2839640 RepID=UPI001BE49EB5|nr:retropepsin-like aspartic protease [Actinomadura sp. NEAU-AAG7]MBT2212381.1 aspartyl protease family protein [Actinomadura sp. NEAU-AAG7]